MKWTIRISLSLLVLFHAGYLAAQEPDLQKATEKVKGDVTEGYKVTVDYPDNIVKNSINSFIKTQGKSQNWLVNWTIKNVKGLPGNVTIYVVQNSGPTQSVVWFGSPSAANDATVMGKCKELARDFYVHCLRDEAERDIQESQKALDFKTEQMNAISERITELEQQIQENRTRNTELEEQLRLNEDKYQELVKLLETTREDLEKEEADLEKMEAVLEQKKRRKMAIK